MKYVIFTLVTMLNNNNTSTALHLQKFKNKALLMCRSVRHMLILCNSLPIDERHDLPCIIDAQCFAGKFCLDNVCTKVIPIKLRNDKYQDDKGSLSYNQEQENEYDIPTSSTNIERNPFFNLTTNIVKEPINNNNTQYP